MLRDELTYSDLNVFFTAVGQNPLLVNDFDAVEVKMFHCLMTPRGERDWEPTFGSNLPSRLFEPMSGRTANKIKEDVLQCLAEQMRDIIKVIPAPTSVLADLTNGVYRVNIYYTLTAQRLTQAFAFNVKALSALTPPRRLL